MSQFENVDRYLRQLKTANDTASASAYVENAIQSCLQDMTYEEAGMWMTFFIVY